MKTAALLLLACAALSASRPPLASASADAPPALAQDAQVGELVDRGRALIAEGRGEEARALLEEADRLDGGALRTRMWLVRALIEVSYLNDALDMTDALATAGNGGADMDYLYGMAFAYKARQYIAQGVDLSTVGTHFADAVAYLGAATQADPSKYGDAYLPLAEAAWNSQRLDIARDAVQRAVVLSGGGAAESFMLGEVAFSQFVAANADAALAEEADAHWQTAFEAFQAAAAAETAAGAEGDSARLARAHKKSGDALVWKGRAEEAAQQYALAMGEDPGSIPYDQILGSLGPESFRAALEAAALVCAKRIEPEDPSNAALLWWLGWARFSTKDYDPAREAFESSYAKWPAYANCQWYIALCRFHRQDKDGALESLLQYQREDPGGLVAAINGNPALYLNILEGLVGHCMSQGRLVDAGRLCAAQANAAPETTRYWNNVGLFYRDAGDELGRDRKEAADPETQQKYYEKALEGYERALALEPENPALLNDTAVVLHYCLERELERAGEMYKRSTEWAKIELARADLTPDERELFQTALKDSQNNLKRLEELRRRRAREAGKDAGAGEDPARKRSGR